MSSKYFSGSTAGRGKHREADLQRLGLSKRGAVRPVCVHLFVERVLMRHATRIELLRDLAGELFISVRLRLTEKLEAIRNVMGQ